ncbi:MAG: hypothetical protein Q9183_007187 [Haloplaca sp. 2 TL-2023]
MDTDSKASDRCTVFDLPQLYNRPSAFELRTALESLRIRPSAWEASKASTEADIDEHGIPSYLTSIISSPLAWIEDDDEKEQIWESAGIRLSERCGRSALPSMSRKFSIPTTKDHESISVTLHEPSLTADNLGHKTWLASYLLAKRLSSLASGLPLLRKSSQTINGPISVVNQQVVPKAIELGAGTGLAGLALAALFPIHVHLTDLPEIVPNLAFNVDVNASHPSASFKGTTSVGPFDWSDIPSRDGKHTRYDLVLAADPLYSPHHPALLVAAIGHVLKRSKNSRVIIELPLREAYLPQLEDLKTRMRDIGLEVETEDSESGFDDWESAQTPHGRMPVTCWWAVWRWSSRASHLC